MANKDRQEVMAVILSVLIAFVLWTYVMGEKNPMQTRIIENVPVILTHQEAIEQSNLALVSGQNFTATLTVEGRALDVFNVSSSDFRLEADMSGYLKKGENNIPIEVKSTPKGVSVINKTGYNYIKVKLDTLVERSVPVSIVVNGNPKESYGYLSPVLKPMEVLVSGPEAYINTIDSAVGQIDISGNYSNVSGSIPVKVQDRNGKAVPYVKVDPKYIDVTIPIKPSKTVPIVVKTRGAAPSNVVIKSIQPKVSTVTIMGDKTFLDKITSIETLPYNLSQLKSGGTKTLNLSIPNGVVTVNNIKSINVDFTVENKSDRSINVPVTIINEDNTLSYVLSNESVSIGINGIQSDVQGIHGGDIKAVVDVKDVGEGAQTLPVTVTVPDNVKIKSVIPDKVTVTVTKK